MPTPTFDLIDVIKTIQKKKSFIILMTVVAILLGGVFFAIKKKKYKATAQFVVNNPLYGDRNTLFRNYEQRYVDYFGGDDDLDRVTVFLNSDTVKDRIIRYCDFYKIYKLDVNSPTGHAQLMTIFNKNFNVKRTEYKNMDVSYIAYDSVTAANVANTAVMIMEETFRSYYTNMKTAMYSSIKTKIKEFDSSINTYTDSLAHVEASAHGSKVWNEETVKNIRSTKDQLVADRARYISLANEFEVTTNKSMTYIQLVTRALPPTSPTGAGLWIILATACLLGLFFSTGFVLLMSYYRKLNAVQR